MKTGEERELSPKDPLNPSAYKPQWFPDSRYLFLHSRNGKLRQLDVHTSEYRPVLESVTIPPYRDGAANPMYSVPIVLAPDGHAIYYLVRDQEAHQSRILRRDLEGGPEIELCRRNADAVRGLSVSPDGLRLAFQEKASSAIAARGNGEKKPSWTIVTLATSGGQPKEAYRNPHWIEGPVWSKDGARLFFVGGWPRDIFCIPAEGGEPQPLDIGLHDLYFLNIHPDGKQIVFADEQYNNQLWVIKNLLAGPKAAR
jgi:Tol biopolymer transport system component